MVNLCVVYRNSVTQKNVTLPRSKVSTLQYSLPVHGVVVRRTSKFLWLATTWKNSHRSVVMEEGQLQMADIDLVLTAPQVNNEMVLELSLDGKRSLITWLQWWDRG